MSTGVSDQCVVFSDVVGIRRDAISSNMNLALQTANPIG